jgi:hypothetical protein
VRRALTIAVALAVGVGSPAQAAPPKVSQLVVFRDGSVKAKSAVSTRAAKLSVGGRRCTAADGTALAALVRSKPGRLRLHDFGSCSLRASDGGGLFVRAIGGDVNRGQDGWVYKVGRRAATAGAADPGGPFGRGRLRAGQRITWFYCRLHDGGCQRTLEVKLRAESGTLTATVRGYDDAGKGLAVADATVSAGARSAQTDASGVARLDLPVGRYSVVAAKRGLVRSFAERVEVP